MNALGCTKTLLSIFAYVLFAGLAGLTQEPLRNTAQNSISYTQGSNAEPPEKGKQNLPLEIDLEEAKALAVGNSEGLKDAEFQLRASAQLYKLGIREWLPRIEVGYSGSDTVVVGAQDSRLKCASIGITQPLFSGGLASKQRRLAKLQLQLHHQDYEKQKDAVLDEIAHLFHQRIIGDEKQALQMDIYQLVLAELEIAEIQFQAGAITELELVETELEAKNLQLELKATQLELQNLDYRLKKKMGIDLDIEVQWRGAVDADYSGILLPGNAEGLCEIALENNPQIKSQRFTIYKLSEELKIARKAYLPNIDAEASFSISGESFPLQEPGFSISLIVSFPEGFIPLETSFSLGARGTISSSRGLAAEGRLAENISSPLSYKLAKQALERERTRERELQNDLFFEIRESLDRHSHLVEKLSLQRAFLELELKKLAIMNRQLETGEIKRIDLLKARARHLDSRIDLLEDILLLLDRERYLEELLGVEPGTLNQLFPEGDGYASERDGSD